MVYLFTIEDIFVVRDKGTVLAGIAKTDRQSRLPEDGAAIEIRLPCGQRFEATVMGMDVRHPCFSEGPPIISILVGPQLHPDAVVRGAEVWAR